MQNLFRFIQRYSNFLLFLGLEVAAFLLFILTQPYQHSRVFSASNHVVASVNSSSSSVVDYFSLARVNRNLIDENARLNEQIMQLRSQIEPWIENDSSYYYSHLTWQFIPAKVVDLQTSTNHNYVVINKGSRDGIEGGQGVMSHDGVVGVVSKVNTHFSLVIPLIHPKMNLSCRVQKNNQQGFLHWQGPSYRYANLDDVGRHVDVALGDTIVTSGLTTRFPEAVMVGIVDDIKLKDGDANYRISVRLSTDYKSLKYVQVVQNPCATLRNQLTSLEQ